MQLLKKHYFLGMATEYAGGRWLKHLFTFGTRRDYDKLTRFLSRRYKGKAILCKNGRSALALALRAYFDKGDAIIVNGFTCYAVYEAVKAAGLVPVFVDISKEDLNYDFDAFSDMDDGATSDDTQSASLAPVVAYGLESPGSRTPEHRVKGIIIQNTLGNPVNIEQVERFAKKHNLIIIEDLAHCAGVKYADGREAGTVGVACALSFGKDKSIDTISGGALVLREPCKYEIDAPSKTPKSSDHLRAKFYPIFGAMCRNLTYLKIGGALMRFLVKIHWIEKSADNKLDLERKPSKFEAKLALEQLRNLRRSGEPPIRDFCYVRDRDEVLRNLQKAGYYFGGLWYEKPVSPARYYKKVHFPETDCPNAVWVAEHILNLPTYYTQRDLTPARKIIQEYLVATEVFNRTTTSKTSGDKG